MGACQLPTQIARRPASDQRDHRGGRPLTSAGLGVTLEEIQQGGYLVSPAALAEELSGGAWVRARHHETISLALTEVAAGRNDRLIINAPSQHGKSEVASHWFPTYALAHNPKLRIGLASYSHEWARHWGLRVRETLLGNFPALGVGMGKYSKAAYRWETQAGGGMYCAGIMGSWSGRPLDLLIIDDPVKDYEEACSDVIQKRNWNWWVTVARLRLRGGGVVLIQTRWHEEDLAGKLIAAMRKGPGTEGYEKWKVLNLPGLGHWQEDGTRVPDAKHGTALWGENKAFTTAEVRKTQVVMGSSKFSAIYQGEPVPEEGHVIKRDWLRYYTVLPADLDQWLQSWDTTLDDTEGADNVSGLVLARKGARAYLVDRENDRLDFPATLAAMRAMTAKWPQATLKVVEKAATGPAAKKMLDHEIHGIVLEPVAGRPGKARRLKAVSPLFEAGNVFLPDPSIAPWVTAYVDELCGFPTVPHDDDVDSTSQGLARLMPGLWAREEEPEPEQLAPEVRAAALKEQIKKEFWDNVRKARLPPKDNKSTSRRMLEGRRRR